MITKKRLAEILTVIAEAIRYNDPEQVTDLAHELVAEAEQEELEEPPISEQAEPH